MAASSHGDTTYPMRAVSRLTGLTADTIRAWERRYRAVKPERTEGNARRYSESEVRRLALLRQATERGHTISEIAAWSEDRLLALMQEEAASDLHPRRAFDTVIDSYLEAIQKFEARRGVDLLGRTLALLSAHDGVFRIVVPLLQKVGEQWRQRQLSIAHEHLISNQLKGLLSTMLMHTPPAAGAPRLVVATPPGHLHEFGSLIGAFVAASRGMEAIYLGTDVPCAELDRVMQETGASLLLLSVVRDLQPEELAELVGSLRQLARARPTWIGAPKDHELIAALPEARFFSRFEDLDTALAKLHMD